MHGNGAVRAASDVPTHWDNRPYNGSVVCQSRPAAEEDFGERTVTFATQMLLAAFSNSRQTVY